MIGWIIAFLSIWCAMVVGAVLAVKHWRRVHNRIKEAPSPGWIYFISSIGGAEDDPPAPIKIGRTSRNPKKQRLPEIQTMSPKPLEVLWSFYTLDSKVAELQAHSALQQFRLYGEWFERGPTLMFIDYLRGLT